VVPESAAERLAAIRAQLPASTQLLAVSKGHPASAIRELAGLGQLSFGESRLQEAVAKQAELADLPSLDWHFIGRLQANKVRPVLQRFAWLHSVDSLALAERVARIAGEEGVCPKLLLQVKLRPDPAKGGFTPEDLRQAWPQLRALPGVQLVGLMTMAPLGLDAAQRRSMFGDCAALAQELGLGQLSMGMSGDWPEAAAAGSTWVRIGSALFGSKPLSPPAWDAI
jgi:pyridoxal phosphate enzyme (YggS family)